jgi:hypothetical protein
MALTKNVHFSGAASIMSSGAICLIDQLGATFNDCYIKVGSVSASKSDSTATVCFLEAEDGKLLFEKTYGFKIDLDGPNPIKQAYEYLKTLPEFSDAEDC